MKIFGITILKICILFRNSYQSKQCQGILSLSIYLLSVYQQFSKFLSALILFFCCLWHADMLSRRKTSVSHNLSQIKWAIQIFFWPVEHSTGRKARWWWTASVAAYLGIKFSQAPKQHYNNIRHLAYQIILTRICTKFQNVWTAFHKEKPRLRVYHWEVWLYFSSFQKTVHFENSTASSILPWLHPNFVQL